MAFVKSNINIFDTGATQDSAASTTQKATTYQPIYQTGKSSSVEVMLAAPLIGKVDIRTTAIADRLTPPASQEARDYALATRQQAVGSVIQLMKDMTAEDDGVVPGLFKDIRVYGLIRGPVRDPFLPPSLNYRTLAEFHATPSLHAQLLQSPAVAAPDEAEHFSQTTDFTDNSVALLRQFEANVSRYREVLTRCELALNNLKGIEANTAHRLDAASDLVAEARHNVSVARALFAEETDRIAAVNARRAEVLANEVKFVAYMRPREVDNLRQTLTHAVDPGLLDAPVPACLREHPNVPDELGDMLRVLREAPANWFVKAPPLLQQLDKMDHLTRLLQTSQMRAAAGIAVPNLASQALGGSKLGQAIAQVAKRQADTLAPRVAAVQKLNLAGLVNVTWQGVRAQAEQVVSFADLAEGGHGRPDVARAAAAELDAMRSIIACLHAEFSAVPPIVRLEWADTLSEFDAAPNLRNLANLAHWSDIPYADRRQMQAYVDWLFAQVQVGEPQAAALINDLVRMCMLIACHAPVDRIIAGRMARPITGAVVGLHIPLTVEEPARLRVGMQALLYRGAELLGRAKVADIGALEVTAEVIHTSAAKVDLGNDIRIHFDAAAAVSLTSATASRSLFGR